MDEGVIKMKRLIMNDLIAWKQSKRRKPLVLRGARYNGTRELDQVL